MIVIAVWFLAFGQTTAVAAAIVVPTLAGPHGPLGSPTRTLSWGQGSGQQPQEDDEDEDEDDGENEGFESQMPEGQDQAGRPGQAGPVAPPAPPLLNAVWKSQLPAAPIARPGFDATRIFVPLRDQLLAASLLDGQVLWTIDLPFPSEPVTGAGLVFVISDERLVSVAPEDGSILWGFQLGGRPSAPLTWDAGWLFAATENAELFALRASDGQLQWRRALGSPLRAPAIPAAAHVYVALEDGRVAALDIHTGETLWERALNGTPTEIRALDDRIFVGSKDNFFYCLDVRTGKVRWRWRTGADVLGNAVVDEDRVYFISLDNVLRALDRGRGGLEWHRGLPMRASSGPVMLEHVLVVPGVAAEFMAFSLNDGTYVGSYRAAADLAAPPHLFVKPVDEGTSAAPLSPPASPDAPASTEQAAGDDETVKEPSANHQLIVLTRDGGLEALVRAPLNAPAVAPPPASPELSAAPGQQPPSTAPVSPPQTPAQPAPAAPPTTSSQLP